MNCFCLCGICKYSSDIFLCISIVPDAHGKRICCRKAWVISDCVSNACLMIFSCSFDASCQKNDVSTGCTSSTMSTNCVSNTFIILVVYVAGGFGTCDIRLQIFLVFETILCRDFPENQPRDLKLNIVSTTSYACFASAESLTRFCLLFSEWSASVIGKSYLPDLDSSSDAVFFAWYLFRKQWVLVHIASFVYDANWPVFLFWIKLQSSVSDTVCTYTYVHIHTEKFAIITFVHTFIKFQSELYCSSAYFGYSEMP